VGENHTRAIKILSIALLVIVAGVSLWFASPQPAIGMQGISTPELTDKYYAYGYGDGGGGLGGGGAPTGPGITSLTTYTNSEGLFALVAAADSDDGKAVLSFTKGVLAKAKDGTGLKSVSILPVDDPPAAPKNSKMIGLAYELGPTGASFIPSITLTISYDSNALPIGFKEQRLSIAVWNATDKVWETVDGVVVDANNHTISVPVSHFSIYGVIATVRPASISMKNISISPGEANIGDTVTISALVENSGDLSGEYTLRLEVNGQLESTQEATFEGNTSTNISFTVTRDKAGTYEVDVNGQLANFIILPPVITPELVFKSLAVFPNEPFFGEEAVFSVLANNNDEVAITKEVVFKIDDVVVNTVEVSLDPGSERTVEYSTSDIKPGNHQLDVNGQKISFIVKTPEPLKSTGKINWLIIGIIIFIVIGLSSFVAFRLTTRSRYIPPVPPKAH
jgi:hypothetical protein